jgi:DNA/RNA-binding domain of Phe-tRNA-synthetase-like protein
MTYFQYDPAILAQYPNLTGGIIRLQNTHNPPSSPELQAAYLAEQTAVREKIGETPLSELPALAGWRVAFRQFGVDPTQYRSACESLLRRLTKKGDIPSINTLVDIGNLVSIRYGLPIAILDMAQIAGTITVHVADGSETFIDLHETEPVHPAVGEVVFSDVNKQVVARRWCWRQSATSAASETTTEALITIEAQHAGGETSVRAAVQDILPLLQLYAGGTAHHALLNAANPAFQAQK